jgi:hypothetical protein
LIAGLLSPQNHGSHHLALPVRDAITLDTAAVNGIARKSANGSSGSTARVSVTDLAGNFLNASFDIVGFC